MSSGNGRLPEPDSVRRADELVTEWEQLLEDLGRRALARAVEEAEDIWHEAKELHRSRSTQSPPRTRAA
jgi:hypothetical protein